MKSISIRSENPLYPGYLYVPDTAGPHPGILLLHGSEGGYGDFWTMPGGAPLPTGENGYVAKMAKHFASLGFTAYAYSYFHAEEIKGFATYPPNELANIDIKNTSEALAWLKNSPFVQGRPVGLWGGSRGAEHALILTSLLSQLDNFNSFPDVIVADSPSDFVYPGLSLEAAKALSTGAPFPENFPSAWSLNGNPVEMYSPIAIERIKSPILITYGAEDIVWGPYVDVKKLHQRLISNGIRAMHFDFKNSDDPNQVIDLISKSFLEDEIQPKAIFIHFMDEGHNPKPNTNSSLLSSKLTEFFLKNYLKR